MTASRPLGCPLRIDHHLAPAPEYADLSGSTCRGAGKLVADPEARAKRERERVFNRRREAERRERMRGA